MDSKTSLLKNRVFARGTLFLKPGLFHISKWVPYFNPHLHKLTNSQVSIHIFDLSLDYWKEDFFLMDIAARVGTPLEVDEKTLEKGLGFFAGVLADINFARERLDRILVQRRDFEFFVGIEYEKCPLFCKMCGVIDHSMIDCR